MENENYARVGRHAAPLFDYDYTNEYLNKLKGVDYIPCRKRDDYKKIEKRVPHRNYITPLMKTISNSRPIGNQVK